MKDSLILEGKVYISAKRAARIINYAQDYIGQLCRSGKLDCTMVGRTWFVTEESLLSHRENAIDATQERVAKVTKIFESDTAQENNVTAPAPVVTPEPIAVPVSAFKYEAETKSLLPEITKKVPAIFALPKNIGDLARESFAETMPRGRIQPASTMALSASPRPLAVTLAAAFLAVSVAGLSLTFSAGKGIYITSVFSDFFEGINLTIRTLPKLAAANDAAPVSLQNTSSSASISKFNGIAIAPSTGSVSGDDAVKEEIRNSFSDEVVVHPDENGTAGIITPVFRKSTGDDFVYVLVPIKEKK